VLESHREVLAERAELVAQLRRLGPAWVELRGVLNELHRVLGNALRSLFVVKGGVGARRGGLVGWA
jgi:hypothetical protein